MGVVFCKDSQFAKIYNTTMLSICDIFLNSTEPVLMILEALHAFLVNLNEYL